MRVTCKECGRSVRTEDAIHAGVNDGDGEVYDEFLCPDCAELAEIDNDIAARLAAELAEIDDG